MANPSFLHDTACVDECFKRIDANDEGSRRSSETRHRACLASDTEHNWGGKGFLTRLFQVSFACDSKKLHLPKNGWYISTEELSKHDFMQVHAFPGSAFRFVIIVLLLLPMFK